MAHVHELKPKIQPRINRLRGQLDGLQRMLDTDDQSCMDVLQQVAAIRGAVNGLMHTVLEEHIRHHFMEDMSDSAEGMEQLLKVLKTYMK